MIKVIKKIIKFFKSLFDGSWKKKDIILIDSVYRVLKDADIDHSGALCYNEIKDIIKKLYKDTKEKILSHE